MHFIILAVGSVLFLWWFHGAGSICAGMPLSPDEQLRALSQMPPVEQKLELLNTGMIETAGYLRLITARTTVVFSYLIFVVLVLGHRFLGRRIGPGTEQGGAPLPPDPQTGQSDGGR